MNFHSTAKLLGTLCTLAAAIESTSAAPVPAEEEIVATAAWFDGLAWPDVREKPYVEVMFGKARVGARTVDGPTTRGFLLAEDDKTLTIFSDGTVAKPAHFSESGGWPFVVQRIAKFSPGATDESRLAKRILDLPAAVAELIAELHRPKDEDEKRHLDFGRKTSDRTAVFVLARCCARQGRADLAGQLDAEVAGLPAGQRARSEEKYVGFRTAMEREIAHVLMWKAVVDCGDASFSRPDLLAEFERIGRDFPASEHVARAAGFVERLRAMIAEDEAHARAAKPLADLSAEEKVRELIFRLREIGRAHV